MKHPQRILLPLLLLLLTLPGLALAADHSGDIVDTAVAAGSFETLVAAVQAAGLVDTLKSDGPFTVFAPTDEAFAKLPRGTLDTLLQPGNRDLLTEILTYHVVGGRVTASQAASVESAETVAGSRVSIRIADGRLQINDSNVTANDIRTSNGIIHVIDSVLLPPGAGERLAESQGRKVLGVYLSRPDKALAAQLGVDRHESLLITGLTSSGPARRAGIRKYDVITAIDGRVASRENFDWAKSQRSVGQEIEIEVLRRGRSLNLSVPVALARH
ncbi:MAG: fasciclin domain-containing protein [Acidobacteriota bacterium]